MADATRAIVIGGSIAGMAIARVLCDFFDRVVIVDRDHYPNEIAPRSGVPQSRHAHALLGRGQNELEGLFPGFIATMRANGAQWFDPGLGLAQRRFAGWQAVGASGVELLWSSRDLLEFVVRSQLKKHARVELLERAQVLGLSGTRERVTGVRLRREGEGESTLDAELVVDASGRHTHVERWLNALGLDVPATQCVDAHAGYASRFYRPPPPERRPREWWWKGLWVEGQPGLPRGGVVFPIEGDRWMVTVAGFGGDLPPIDERGFLDFIGRLSSSAIARALTLAEPLSDISGNRSMANVFRRYDRWRSRPRGFIATGDSVCAFNPIYGQGMSAAAASAGILGKVLRSWGRAGAFERAFFNAQAEFLTSAWNLATGADFQWPTTEGERPRVPAALTSYLNLAMESAHHDPELRRQLMPVFNLTGTMQECFFAPRFAAKALASAAERRLRARLLGPARIADLPPQPA